MPELKVVKLEKLDPNPWRDSTGHATWASVADVYGFDEGKLKELMQSYETNGVWAGVHVRPNGNRFDLAFGHHRVEAARRLKIEVIPVVVAELSDDEMLRMMAAENSEEYGHDFALGVMNAVEAVIKAYAAGVIQLDKPERARNFAGPQNTKPFTVETISNYLGWRFANGQADKRIHIAVNALQLIEEGALKRSEFKGLGSQQVRELVTLTIRKIDSEKEKLAVQQEFLEKQKQAALKEDDRRKIAQVEKKLEELAAEAPKVVKQAGRQVAGAVTGFFKDGSSYTEAARKAAEALKVAPPVAKVKIKTGLTLGEVSEFISRLDATLLDDDSRFQKILLFADGNLSGRKTFKELELSLLNLSERAKLRAKELKKVVS